MKINQVLLQEQEGVGKRNRHETDWKVLAEKSKFAHFPGNYDEAVIRCCCFSFLDPFCFGFLDPFGCAALATSTDGLIRADASVQVPLLP